jgi:hypothetical protein
MRDIDIWRVATLMIKRYGGDTAPVESAREEGLNKGLARG